MTRYKITIEYDGTDFSGWQRQHNASSVQEFIEQAIEKFTGQKTVLYCAGRTDAGVHALGQVAHFDLDGDSLQTNTVVNAINYHLRPKPIVILDCKIVTEDFHARFSAKKRFYEYRILNRHSSPALDEKRVWHIKYPLNVDLMQQAASYLIGQHDFSSFRASQCQAHSPIKTIEAIKIAKSEYIIIEVEAISFLYHMVRNIVGTLVLAGMNKITPGEVKNILDACDRTKAGVTAPAAGLYFKKVLY